MTELQELSEIRDRAQRLAGLQTYVQSHEYDPYGWYMLHVESQRAGDAEASEVYRRRAVALDVDVQKHFRIDIDPHAAAESPASPGPDGPTDLAIPGYQSATVVFDDDSATLYEARDPHGARCLLRVLHGESNAATRHILERQQLARSYPGCLEALRIVESDAGVPVQVLAWTDASPVGQSSRLLEPDGARQAVAALCAVLEQPHRDGLIAGDLRPASIFGSTREPGSLQILGVRRPIDGQFGTLAGDAGRYRWYAAEEGAGQLDARTDLYGLGLLLWWLVSGQEPPRLGERLKTRLATTGDQDLDRIIARCTRSLPAERYQDVSQLRDELLATPTDSLRVGGWTLGARLGGGQVADVHRARHEDGREAIVKVFARALNYERELAVLRAVHDPGIVHLLDASPDGDEHRYIALAVQPGETLAELVARGPLPVELATAIVRKLAATLAALHARGIVHRDVKPSNVLVHLGPPLGVTLFDFDMARLRERPELDDDTLIGTPSHMSPEQWIEPERVDARADVYGLGLTWFECLAGKHPLPGGSFTAWQRAHLSSRRPHLQRAGVPAHHRRLLDAMIARDLEQRPPTMAAVLRGLARPRPPWWIAIAGAGVLALLAVTLFTIETCRAPEPADPYPRFAVALEGAPIEGPPDALVTIVVASEYLSTECSLSARYLGELRRAYPRELRVAHRPFLVHPVEALSASLAACAADKQGRFAELDASLWERYRQWTVRTAAGGDPRRSPFDLAPAGGATPCWDDPGGCPIALQVARRLALDVPRFQRDMERCERDVRLYQAQLSLFGVTRPPVIFVNGRLVAPVPPSEAFVAINRMIAEELDLARARIHAGAAPGSYYDDWVLHRE